MASSNKSQRWYYWSSMFSKMLIVWPKLMISPVQVHVPCPRIRRQHSWFIRPFGYGSLPLHSNCFIALGYHCIYGRSQCILYSRYQQDWLNFSTDHPWHSSFGGVYYIYVLLACVEEEVPLQKLVSSQVIIDLEFDCSRLNVKLWNISPKYLAHKPISYLCF